MISNTNSNFLFLAKFEPTGHSLIHSLLMLSKEEASQVDSFSVQRKKNITTNH